VRIDAMRLQDGHQPRLLERLERLATNND